MGNFKFCPNCGFKVEESSKFCPECGKVLVDGASSRFSFSNISKGFSSLFGKVKESHILSEASDSISGVANKVKSAVKEKSESTRVTAKVVGKVYQENKERVISKLSADYMDSILGKSIIIEFTNMAVKIYESTSILDKLHKEEAINELLYDIPLDDIKEVYRQKNINGNIYYYLVTSEKEHPIYLKTKPYQFFQKLSSVLKFNGSLYNIDILPDETMKCIANGKINGSNCTIYLTDKRILATAIGNFDKLAGLSTEGVKLILDVWLSKVKIQEKLGKLNADYIISSSSGNFTISFNQLVPKEFISVVPGAVGNQEQLDRKKKLKKGLKVVTLAASLLGAEALDASGEDLDIEEDVEPTEIDIDGDGNVDAVAVDVDGDGQLDTLVVDSNNDGTFDTIATDSDGDGNIDKAAYDTNGDGAFDEIEMDTDGDGVIDTAGVDTNGDGSIDTVTEGENANDGTDSCGMEESYHNAQSRVMEIDRQIMNTPDPMQRAALIREKELIMANSPSPADIMLNRMNH